MGGRLNYIEPEEGTGATPFDELPPNESRHTSLLTPLEISMVQFAYRAASPLMTSRMIALPKARAALSSRSAIAAGLFKVTAIDVAYGEAVDLHQAR